jgi:hypothetical protein
MEDALIEALMAFAKQNVSPKEFLFASKDFNDLKMSLMQKLAYIQRDNNEFDKDIQYAGPLGYIIIKEKSNV